MTVTASHMFFDEHLVPKPFSAEEREYAVRVLKTAKESLNKDNVNVLPVMAWGHTDSKFDNVHAWLAKSMAAQLAPYEIMHDYIYAKQGVTPSADEVLKASQDWLDRWIKEINTAEGYVKTEQLKEPANYVEEEPNVARKTNLGTPLGQPAEDEAEAEKASKAAPKKSTK